MCLTTQCEVTKKKMGASIHGDRFETVPRSSVMPLVVTSIANQKVPTWQKTRTGVYFRNREVSQPYHLLQTTQDRSSTVGLGSRRFVLPQGRPLAPPPPLGHLHTIHKFKKKDSIRLHVAAPVAKFTKTTTKHKRPVVAISNIKKYPISSSALGPDEKLFVEAAASLCQLKVPVVNNRQEQVASAITKTTRERVSRTALPPPPFRIAETTYMYPFVSF